MALGAWIACCLFAGAAQAERRVALVIGNANYEHAGVLANTLNDAHAMTALFKRAGFDLVDEHINLGVVEMKRTIRDFAAAASKADIAVVYYSGHGLEVAGANYLVPVDARLSGAYDVEDEAVALDRLQTATRSASRLSLIILDACRENPFTPPAEASGQTRGISLAHTLGVQPTGADTLIAYAAKAGSVSFDGFGPNGPFTAALVKYIAEPGLDIRIALGRVRDEVLTQTWGKQEPYVYGSLGGGIVSLAPAEASASGTTETSTGVAADYAMAERIGAADAWRSFLANHAAGYYADLARAQLDKLTTAEHANLPPDNVLASNGSPSRKPTPAPPAPVAAIAQPPATLQAMAAPELPVETNAGEACRQEDVRLTQLRKNPSAQDVSAFARQMNCAALRPQANRLLESLGLPPVAASPASSNPGAAPSAEQAAISPCIRDRETLDRLRISQNAEAVAQFAGALQCEAIRPQLERLMESLGVKTTISPAPQTRGITQEITLPSQPTVDQRAACAKESQDLVKLRADPQRTAVQRFASSLNCEALKPQVARLLESLGD